jgi:hypothetical protein
LQASLPPVLPHLFSPTPWTPKLRRNTVVASDPPEVATCVVTPSDAPTRAKANGFGFKAGSSCIKGAYMSFYRSGLGDAVWLTLPLQFLVSLNNLGGREKSKDLIIFVKQRTYQHLHFSKADLVSSLECGCGHALCGSRGGAASSRDTDRHHGHNDRRPCHRAGKRPRDQ